MKFLVIGCGSIGRRHARNLRDLGVKDILVFDPERDRSAQLAHEYEVLRVETLEQAYEHRPGAVLICAPTSLHLTLARQALQHDCHIFLEKPLSHTMEGVIDFLAEVKARHRILLVGYNLRFDPLLHQLRVWLNDSRIGHVASARLHFGSYLPWRHPWEDYRVGYGARRSLGGGVILDAIHELDYALWLFGLPERVYCAGGKSSDLEIDVEDLAEVSLLYPNAVISIHLDYIQRPPERSCHVIGTRGTIRANLIARSLHLFDGTTRQRATRRIDCPFEQTYQVEIQHFIDCIGGGAKPLVDGYVAAQSLQVAETARESMATGLPVALRTAPVELVAQ
jgi:predicted dehydrogenase